MRRPVLSVFLTCAIGCALVSGLGYAGDMAPYKIGICVSLTGPAASIGEPERNGALVRINDINAAGGINGRKLEAVVDDEQGAPDKAVIGTKRLIDVEKVVALAGYEYSGAAMAAIVPAEAGSTPMVVGCVTEKTWMPTKKWTFSVVPRQKDAYNIILDSFLQQGAKKIACIYVDAAMGQMAREALSYVADQRGIKLAVEEKYSLGTSDISPQITHIKSAGADAIFIGGYVPDAAMVVKTARALGFTGIIGGDQAVLGPEFIKLVGKDGEGFITTTRKALVAGELDESDPQKKVATDLYEKYTKEHGVFALGGVHGWDTVNLISEALKKTDPKLDPAKPEDVEKIRVQVRDNLENLGSVIGQNGIFNITPDNHNGLGQKSHVALVLKDGSWKKY